MAMAPRKRMNTPGSLPQMLRASMEAIEKRFPHFAKAEVTPPGYEPVVKALKKKPGVDNPWAVAWAMKGKESAAPGSHKIRETGSFRVLEAMKDGPNGEKIFKVILISEGPGNRRNKNFYGPEAVASSVKAFEGKWCYLNHQSADEAESLPERRVQDKAGYFKNLGLMQVKEGSACAGELHCDLSESGAMLAAKVQSALKYKESFPNNDLEYVGFSVNADGDAEPRDMTDKGGGPDDNYVTAITEGDSCDLVTTPARGGRGLAVIKEAEAGAVTPTSQEDGMKKLQAIFAKFVESHKDTKDAKVKESVTALAAAFKEAEGEAAEESEAGMDAMLAKREGESDEDHLKRLHGMAKAIQKHLPQAEEEAAAPGEEPAPKADDADAQESKKDAIAGLIRESGMPKDFYTKEDLARLAGLKYAEAKREIGKDAKLAKTIRESMTGSVASFHRGIAETGANNEAAFLEAARKED